MLIRIAKAAKNSKKCKKQSSETSQFQLRSRHDRRLLDVSRWQPASAQGNSYWLEADRLRIGPQPEDRATLGTRIATSRSQAPQRIVWLCTCVQRRITALVAHGATQIQSDHNLLERKPVQQIIASIQKLLKNRADEACPHCNSAMQHIDCLFWMNKTNNEWKVSLPFCPFCESELLGQCQEIRRLVTESRLTIHLAPEAQNTQITVRKNAVQSGIRLFSMHRQWLKDVKEALAKALQGLNGVRMTPQDDPQLAALKDDIRRTIEQPRHYERAAS